MNHQPSPRHETRIVSPRDFGRRSERNYHLLDEPIRYIDKDKNEDVVVDSLKVTLIRNNGVWRMKGKKRNNKSHENKENQGIPNRKRVKREQDPSFINNNATNIEIPYKNYEVLRTVHPHPHPTHHLWETEESRNLLADRLQKDLDDHQHSKYHFIRNRTSYRNVVYDDATGLTVNQDASKIKWIRMSHARRER